MSTARKGLPQNTEIQSDEGTYRILGEFAQGGSALIYKAIKNSKEKVTLKEIYPSDENGFFERNMEGQVMPPNFEEAGGLETTRSYYQEYQKEKNLLDRLYRQLEKEEDIGRRLRDDSFLVCNLKVLKNPHLQGKSTILKGFAEMQDMNFSGKVLSKHFEELSLKYQNAIPLETSLHIIKQIAETMLKIHNSGYLYCDFSKENIFLLNETMTAVFIDFGSTMEKVKDYVETDQFIPATWGYRAPEVAMQNYNKGNTRIICEASDVYALMTFFYELISGTPFARESEFGAAKCKHARDRMVDWKRMQKIGIKNPVAGLILNHILLSGLAWEQKDRIPSIRKLLELIKRLELIQKKADHLYETLEIASAWKYEEKVKILAEFLKSAVPERRDLNEALERLGKELLSAFHLGNVTYIYTWLEIWFRRLEEMTGEEESARMRLLLEYSGLAICNHHGKYHEAILHYNACEKMKDQIELSQYLDARLRMAEGHANFFNYQKAYSLIEQNMKLLEMRKACYKEMAEKLGTYTESITKTAEYGKNASALARYATFLGGTKIKKAEKYFELAANEFEFDLPNRTRVYNAALQMAVSGRRKDLFEKYCRLSFGNVYVEDTIVKILEMPSIKGQDAYDLYALLKGIRVFALEEQMSETFWKELESIAEDEMAQKKGQENHPWELIYRHVAILLAKHRNTVDETVEKLFLLSRKTMKEFQGLSDISFDTVLVLHMITLIQEYQLRLHFAETSADMEKYREKAATCMEELFQYLQNNKCNVIKKKEWESAQTIEEKYKLLKKCSVYEYA